MTGAGGREDGLEFIARDGVSLAYVQAGRDDGKKPPILLVHGMQCNHTHMLAQLDYFSRRHRVVAVDLRGHGESDAPRRLYSNFEFNDDLIFLCRELGLARPVAMGHSFGGSTLLHLAAEHPEFLSGASSTRCSAFPSTW
jgi:pimeloyl-ACP methyl ester carboxylesterase